jgi:hypothetical protein
MLRAFRWPLVDPLIRLKIGNSCRLDALLDLPIRPVILPGFDTTLGLLGLNSIPIHITVYS